MAAASSSILPPEQEKTTPDLAPQVRWLDLLDCLLEKILERLPFPYYLTFAAVCRRWRSIQSDHRRRHAPSRPTMVTRPWFIPRRPKEECVICSDPFAPDGEQRSHRLRIPLSKRYLKHHSEGRAAYSFSLPNGWLLLDDQPGSWGDYHLTLLNPLVRDQIELRPVADGLAIRCRATSSASCPPDTILFVFNDKWNIRMELFRGDKCCQEYCIYNSKFKEFNDVILQMVSPIFWKGKFYCMFLSKGLLFIDPAPEESELCLLEMDQRVLPKFVLEQTRETMDAFLVESDGRLLLVVEFWEGWCSRESIIGFQVFEADFDRRRWIEVESLGDRMLLLYGGFIVSLLAADIRAEKNCIYYEGQRDEENQEDQEDQEDDEGVPWAEFDMDSGEITKASLRCAPPSSTHLMFVPSIF